MEPRVVRVGSRKSELALIQTNYVIECLQKGFPEIKFDIVTMTTLGDRILNISLPKIGEKSLFTKDLEDALDKGTVDFVVHSLKDLPTTLPDGLAIGAVFEREDPRDALVLREDHKDKSLSTLPPLSCIGTSSLRRTAQLRAMHPHLRVVDVRGNLNTRLRKLEHHSSGEIAEQEYAALILAHAGLVRMGWQDRVSQVLPCSEMMYAVGQGALAVECRADNTELLSMLAPFNHPETYCRILVERSFLKALGGGCSAPVGVSTSLKPFNEDHKLTISGAVWSLDGNTKVHHKLEHMFQLVRRNELGSSSKHKLSPTDENEHKKVKIYEPNGSTSRHTDRNSPNQCQNAQNQSNFYHTENDGRNSIENPIMKLNRTITEQHSIAENSLNCEDTRSEGEVSASASQSDNDVAALAQNVNLNDNTVDLSNINVEDVDKLNVSCKNNAAISVSGNGRPLTFKSDIYCGLSENTNVLKDVIEKCESLGKELADILIGKGALEVMKTSQDYIRSSIKKT